MCLHVEHQLADAEHAILLHMHAQGDVVTINVKLTTALGTMWLNAAANCSVADDTNLALKFTRYWCDPGEDALRALPPDGTVWLYILHHQSVYTGVPAFPCVHICMAHMSIYHICTTTPRREQRQSVGWPCQQHWLAGVCGGLYQVPCNVCQRAHGGVQVYYAGHTHHHCQAVEHFSFI